MEKNIDIIIPIYNAYDDLVKCIDSLIMYTDLNTHNIVCINDNSTDERIDLLLANLSIKSLKVVNNLNNLGFSASVNIGIDNSKNDVLILNSDTIVTKNWLEKIASCAYSDKAISTVTPFSNNATLCSIPNFCNDNTIPNGFSIDSYADLIERCSLKIYPRITVGVGFCMFIKREVIEKVGNFDSNTFGRGYGEENDFCYRAQQLGYYDVLCDNTFIFHSGTTSFNNQEKLRLIESHDKILKNRYENQVVENHKYVMTNPHQYLRDNVNMYVDMTNGKKNLLYILHSDFRVDSSNNVGGTQFHVKDLTSKLKREYNIFIVARDQNQLRVTYYSDLKQIDFKFYIGLVETFPVLFNQQLSDILRNVLLAFKIDIVHVHHTQGLSLDIFYLANEFKIPLLCTIHDYYYVCPNVKLLDYENKICIGCENTEHCYLCLKKSFNYETGSKFLSNWRIENSKVLNLCDQIITPSNDCKKNLLKYYPNLHNKVITVPHGTSITSKEILKYKINKDLKIEYSFESVFNKKVDIHKISGWAYIKDLDSYKSEIYVQIEDKNAKKYSYKTVMFDRLDVARGDMKYCFSGFSVSIPKNYFSDGDIKVSLLIQNGNIVVETQNPYLVYNHCFNKTDSFNVAFIGGMVPSKGSQIAKEMIKSSSQKIEWFIFGGIGDAELSLLERKNLVKSNWYIREELPVMLEHNKIDLVCILPIWPETFCYTVSEAILCKVPVIATDIGAISERMHTMDCGWLIPYNNNSIDILNLINNIIENKNLLQEKKTNILKLNVRSVDEMCKEYLNIYSSLNSVNNSLENINNLMVYNAFKNSNNICDQNDMHSQRSIEIENQLKSILNSLPYKISLKITSTKFPFKRLLKKIALIIAKVMRI